MQIAKDPYCEGLRSLVFADSRTRESEFEIPLEAHIAGSPKMAAVIFPDVTHTKQLVELVSRIAGFSSWRLEIREVENEDFVGVGLRWAMPDREHESWALGFAPFDHMPKTRRAPHVAIVLKTDPVEQPFLKRDPSEVSGLRGIHLADLPFDGTVATYMKTWRKTAEFRQDRLDGFLEKGGKAKVTFTLPAEYRSQIESLQP